MKNKHAKHGEQHGQGKRADHNTNAAFIASEKNPQDTHEKDAHGAESTHAKRNFLQRGFDCLEAHSNTVVAVFTAVIAGATILQWNAIGGQLSEMRDQRNLSVRPWVGIDEPADSVVTPSIHFDEQSEATGAVSIRVRNYSSNNPAQNVVAQAELVITNSADDIFKPDKCGESHIRDRSVGSVVMPGIKVQSVQALRFAASGLLNANVKYTAWLLGCVHQRDQYGTYYGVGFRFRYDDPATQRAVRANPIPNSDISGVWVQHGGSFSREPEVK